MAATVHVVARFLAKPGKEDRLKAVLTALIRPTRRELGCYQYDLLSNTVEPREFCFVERWEHDKALDTHLETEHVKVMLGDVADLLDEPPSISRYHIV